MAKVFVVRGTHPNIPGHHLSVHTTMETARETAAKLVQMIADVWLKEHEDDIEYHNDDVDEPFALPEVSPDNFEDVLGKMVSFELAQGDLGDDEDDGDVWIEEHDLVEPAAPEPVKSAAPAVIDDPRDLPIGHELWHVTDPDGGPDVGISLRLDERRVLYVGELPREAIEDAPPLVQVMRGGWWLCIETDDKERQIVGRVCSCEAHHLIDALRAPLLKGGQT